MTFSLDSDGNEKGSTEGEGGVMIGGEDIIIETVGVPQQAALEASVRHILQYWPSALIEDADTGVRFNGLARVPFEQVRELMIYRDEEAFQSWERLGADPSNANSMFHIIADPGEVTVVVDDADDAFTARILDGIREAVQHGLPPAGLH